MFPYEKLGYVVCSPLIPKSVERTVWKVATATRVPGEPGSPQTFYFQACSDLKRQCLHKDRDSDEGDNIYTERERDPCTHIPSSILIWGPPFGHWGGLLTTKITGNKILSYWPWNRSRSLKHLSLLLCCRLGEVKPPRK